MRIHREGTGVLLSSLAILLSVNLISWYFVPLHICNVILTAFSVFLYLLMVNFFRSPKRHFEGDIENLVIAPADGRIVVAEQNMGQFAGYLRTRIDGIELQQYNEVKGQPFVVADLVKEFTKIMEK